MERISGMVSVIVPIYNIKAYLPRCVESLRKQTYRMLEILLVDDGSTDGSEVLCEQYEKQDRRIRVCHKENGGLSDARNRGLSLAKGEYIVFVDGDDYVSPWHVEYLFRDLAKWGADIACCSFTRSAAGAGSAMQFREKQPDRAIDPKQVVCDMLYGKYLFVAAWGKMYRASLFEKASYPLGKVYEDLGTTYKLVIQAKKIVWAPDVTYCYAERVGSIVHSPITGAHFAAFGFLEEYPRVLPGVRGLEQALACQYLTLSMEFLKSNLLSAEDRPRVWEYVKRCRRQAVPDRRAPLRIRAFALLSGLGLRLTVWSLRLYYGLLRSR